MQSKPRYPLVKMTALAHETRLDEALSKAQFRRRLMMAAAASFAAVTLLFVTSSWRAAQPFVHLAIQSAGLALIIIGIVGRTWCAIHIGGRKKIMLVQDGPYALVRHPLYCFSIIAATGIGALWGSMMVALLLASLTALILAPVTRREEAFLASTFGTEYSSYSDRVGRFLPRRFCERARHVPTIHRYIVIRTFAQSSLFLVAIGVAFAAGRAQDAGLLPTLIQLP